MPLLVGDAIVIIARLRGATSIHPHIGQRFGITTMALVRFAVMHQSQMGCGEFQRTLGHGMAGWRTVASNDQIVTQTQSQVSGSTPRDEGVRQAQRRVTSGLSVHAKSELYTDKK